MVGRAKDHFQAIRKEGGSRVVALTHFLPKRWKMVKVSKVEGDIPQGVDEVILKLKKVA